MSGTYDLVSALFADLGDGVVVLCLVLYSMEELISSRLHIVKGMRKTKGGP